MKIKLFLVGIAAVIMTGCNGTLYPQNVSGNIAGLAAIGSQGALLYNPQYRAGFIMATNVLSQFCNTNQSFTVADLQGALGAIKVNGKAAPYVAGGLNLALDAFNTFAGNVASMPITNQLASLQLGVCAINTGVEQTLQTTASP